MQFVPRSATTIYGDRLLYTKHWRLLPKRCLAPRNQFHHPCNASEVVPTPKSRLLLPKESPTSQQRWHREQTWSTFAVLTDHLLSRGKGTGTERPPCPEFCHPIVELPASFQLFRGGDVLL